MEAVNHLVTSPIAERHFAILVELAKLPATTPVALTGDAFPLNALLDLHREDRGAYDRVMSLVDAKREARGWQSLLTAPLEGFDRNEYQRDFMQQKRTRERQAVEIENMLRPARDKLVGNNRLEFMRRASVAWKTRRDEMLDKVRGANDNTLTREQLHGVLSAFWKNIDDELATQQADALKKLQRL